MNGMNRHIIRAICLLRWIFFALRSSKASVEPNISSPHHTLSLALFIPPLFSNLCSSASTSSLSSCWSHCPPTCLPALVQPPRSASVNVFCPYKERAQADRTNRRSSAGVLQGQGDHRQCRGGVTWEEDGGEWMDGRGGG